jgi:NAD(P)-dependent dehydrogenase (short-subunit alcohol dehydrogenase family)
VDVGNSDDVDEFVSRAVSDYGSIDFVFNCAGVNPTPIPLEETSDEYFDRLVNANLKGVFNVTRACVPYLARSAYPSIVNVSSILGTHGSAQQSVYCATKWGLIGLTKSLALELGPRGIRVNCVAPGEVDTPTNAEIMQGGDAQERMKEKNALGRLGLPQDVVDVVVFLMSEGARYMNGSVVEVDGGMR